MKLVAIELAAICACALWITACGAPQVPAGPPANVKFEPEDEGYAYHVEVTDAAGQQTACDTPCELAVASGTATVAVSGGRSYEQQLVIPQGGSLALVDHQSKGAFASQIALSVVAIAFAIPSIILSMNGVRPFLGLGLAVAGGVAAVALIIVIAASGNNRIELEQAGGLSASLNRGLGRGLDRGPAGESSLALIQPPLVPVFTF